MPIIEASDTYLRPRVIDYLKEMKTRRPETTVLDVGGAMNPWCDDYVTTYIEMQKVPTTREVVIGDICDNAFWVSLSGRRWDFVICTHVLEDIRDPLFVIGWIQKISAAGFIAVPNKHTELSAVESPQYPGYYHHRWVFALRGQVLCAVAKLPLLGYYREANRWLHRMSTRGPFLRRIAARLAPRTIPGGGMVPWYNPAKARHGFELGFIWEGEFKFEYLDDDYC
jgi:hypothetical protein